MNRLVVNADLPGPVIDRHIYGHFAEHLGRCIYGGVWVGEDSAIPNVRGIRTDVVDALRAIHIPNLRWPGGCFADEYHWTDGIGPRAERPTMVNTHWGGVTENNAFGTHEFMDLCEQLGCEPYICGNVGSGTVQEMQRWVEYLTFDGTSPMADLRRRNGRDEPWRIRFWGVGNENWGCGGNMRPEYYADEYRRYATYCRNLSGNELCRVACGPNGRNWHWTDVLMREVARDRPRLVQGLALHYYCGSGAASRSATAFDETDWFAQLKRALAMDEIIAGHRAIMDRYDPAGSVALFVDEWGAWHAVEPGTNPGFLYQQNSIRDALVAALTLHIFHEHCERVRMANIAQTINVLQAMILTEGERMLLTPTYHVFEMLKAHQNAIRLPSQLSCSDCGAAEHAIPGLSASASRAQDGTVSVSLCNSDPNNSATLGCELRGMSVSRVNGRVLTGETITSHNTFDEPSRVAPEPLTGITTDGQTVSIPLPARAVAILTVEP